MSFCDLTGKRYGRLTVMKKAYKDSRGNYYWTCRCDCGNEITVRGYSLRAYITRSCGCLRREATKTTKTTKTTNTTHGQTGTRLYRIYYCMKERATNKHNDNYKYYGARGIGVCNEWMNSFQAFHDWSMANGYKDGLSIDRIDVNGNYEPSNCRWVTMKQQQNNRTNNHYITYNGETHTISEWAELLNMDYHKLWWRISQLHWSINKAFTQ